MGTYDNEIEKMSQEDKVVEIKAKSYIDDFVKEIKKVNKTEITTALSKPQKYKIPFKIRVKRFFERLNKTLG